MSNDRMTLRLKADSEGTKNYWFNFASDNEDSFIRTFCAATNYGNVIGRLVMEPSAFHRGNGYRKYMLWATLPDTMQINHFLMAVTLKGCSRCTELVDVGFDNSGWPCCAKCAPVLEENHIPVVLYRSVRT